jgi:hypothetical protein
MTRKPAGTVKADAFDSDAVRAVCEPVRRRLARFALDNADAIAAAEVERPEGLHDRAWNNWRPLLQIAAVAGEEWLARALQAAAHLSGEEDVEEDINVLALQHVWAIVEPLGRVPSIDVLTELVKHEDAPWAKWWEAKLAMDEVKGPAASLARLLKPFGVKPRQVWVDGRNERGYEADDFRNARVAPYLSETLDMLDTLEPLREAGSRPSKSVESSPGLLGEKAFSHAGSSDPSVSSDLSEGLDAHESSDLPRTLDDELRDPAFFPGLRAEGIDLLRIDPPPLPEPVEVDAEEAEKVERSPSASGA